MLVTSSSTPTSPSGQRRSWTLASETSVHSRSPTSSLVPSFSLLFASPSLRHHSALLVACLGRAACLLSLLSCQGSPCPASAAVTCVIMQKKGAGFHEASSCYWDSANDRTSLSLSFLLALVPLLTLLRAVSYSYRWENKSMHCITSVFAISLYAGNPAPAN